MVIRRKILEAGSGLDKMCIAFFFILFWENLLISFRIFWNTNLNVIVTHLLETVLLNATLNFHTFEKYTSNAS